MHKVFFNKGYVEFRAQFPAGSKVWPALWLISESLVWPPEMDMWEYFGYRPDQGYDVMENALAVNSTVDWYGGHISNFNSTYNNGAWHVYGFQWTTTDMMWTVDGVETTHVNINDLSGADQAKWPNENMYFVLNNGIRSASPDQSNWPNYVVIDYVALYQPGGGSVINPNSWYNVINKTSGMCVDDSGGSTSNGTPLIQWPCGNQLYNQEWQFRAAASGGYYAAFSRHATVLVWDDSGAGTNNGNPIVLWTYGGGKTNQEWKPISLGNGLWQFQNLASGLCLDNGGTTTQGQQFIQWACDSNNTNQQFSLTTEP